MTQSKSHNYKYIPTQGKWEQTCTWMFIAALIDKGGKQPKYPSMMNGHKFVLQAILFSDIRRITC